MRWITAGVAFLLMLAMGFVLGGLFLMPHLPPTPARPVSAVQWGYWEDNWAGLVLGLLLGAASARSTLKRSRAHA